LSATRLGCRPAGRRACRIGVAGGTGPARFDLRDPLESMWETAIRRLGAEPSMLQGSSGVH
jgi:hypothetical protein